ncbi:MAG: hypothetical protein AUK08_02875 [Candidatus Pacebacteria bacterium CG2_30_36_39]|nr:ATP-dependent DNA helicase RecQ [Candidatus Pacearchaeota archaeon]OIP74167.1 MAG: hypothetical protein AUK08_02875 [Candidatus Pacebacteria bacterium CG2_30_36_39]
MENQKILNILNTFFKLKEFRKPQDQIIKTVLENKKTLALLPTGYGKSICYQIPGLYLNDYTLVISPLIALMDDQVLHLKQNNISARAIHSLNPFDSKTFANIKDKFIYISPEKLLSKKFNQIIKENPPALIAIDEAHCFSLWGHDFRPAYRQLPNFIESLDKSVKLILLTATASQRVIDDLQQAFGILKTNTFAGSFLRKNLFIKITNFSLRHQRFLYLCYLVLKKYTQQNGIIYCITRKETEVIFQALKKFDFEKQLKIDYFHAGRKPEEKQVVQNKFLSGKIKLLVTTNAFGMGIDKSDVRFVIHAQLPACLEHYVQEIGRAGRDRKLSFCELLIHPSDIVVQQKLNKNNQALDVMIEYFATKKCHHQKILSFFGEKTYTNFSCAACEYCSPSCELIKQKIRQKIKHNKYINTTVEQQKIIFDYVNQSSNLQHYLGVGENVLKYMSHE